MAQRFSQNFKRCYPFFPSEVLSSLLPPSLEAFRRLLSYNKSIQDLGGFGIPCVNDATTIFRFSWDLWARTHVLYHFHAIPLLNQTNQKHSRNIGKPSDHQSWDSRVWQLLQQVRMSWKSEGFRWDSTDTKDRPKRSVKVTEAQSCLIYCSD